MCTSFQINTKDGAVIHGRSEEFGIPYDSEVVIIPRNSKLKGALLGNNDKKYTNVYSFIGYNQPSLLPERQLFTDGMNEKGLSVSAHYYYYQNYRRVKDEDVVDGMVDYAMQAGWLLGNISSVQEIRERIDEFDSLLYWPEGKSDYGYGLHTIIMDPTGDCVVLEHVGDKIRVKENPLGVMTNGSPLEYHYENMRLYSHLSVYEQKPKHLRGLENHKLLTSGNGLVGMPGDWTANSRFVRAAIISSNAVMQDTAEEGVIMAGRILGSFDFVAGVQRETFTPQGMEAYRGIFENPRMVEGEENTITNHTDSIIVKDLKNLKFYYRDYKHSQLREFDFKDYVDTTDVMIIKLVEDKAPKFLKVTPEVETFYGNYK